MKPGTVERLRLLVVDSIAMLDTAAQHDPPRPKRTAADGYAAMEATDFSIINWHNLNEPIKRVFIGKSIITC